MNFKRKINQIIYHKYFGKNRFKVYQRLGLDLLLNNENHVDRKLICKRGYEAGQISAMLTAAQEHHPKLFIDVGANIGLYSLLAAKSKFFGRIISFEPDERNYEQFRANIFLNGFRKNIELYNKGLSDKTAAVTFLQHKGRNTGKSRVKDTSPSRTKMEEFDTAIIDVVVGDDLLLEQGQIIFIKIDVEGHEQAVIKGISSLLQNNYCRLQIEVFDDSFPKVRVQLEDLGYTLGEQFGVDRIFTNQDKLK